MCHAFVKVASLGVAMACLSGCLSFDSGSGTQECNAYDAELRDLPDRFALGSSYTAEIIGADDDVRAESSDPDVVLLRRVDHGHLELSFIGEGSTTITVSDGAGSTDHIVEVARHERVDILLVEVGLFGSAVVPIGRLNGKALVADVPQHFAVTYADSNGALAGMGLAVVSMPAEVARCELKVDAPLELYCVVLQAPGPHVLGIRVVDDEFAAVVGAVPTEQIGSLVLLHEDESNLESGDLVRIDAIGLTADGVTVHGLHPVFSSKGYSESTEENTAQNAGYFSYTYDAKAATSRLEVHALDFNQQLSFKGERRPPEVLSGCSSSVWPRGGPLNGIVFLASLAFLLRLRRRR